MQYYTKFCNRRVCEDVKMLFRAFFVEIIALICRKTTIRTKKLGISLSVSIEMSNFAPAILQLTIPINSFNYYDESVRDRFHYDSRFV